MNAIAVIAAKSGLRLGVIAGLALVLFAPVTRAQTVQDVVTGIENHYKNVSDLTAKVDQKNVLKAIEKTQTFGRHALHQKAGQAAAGLRERPDHPGRRQVGAVLLTKSDQVIKKTFTDIEQMNIPVLFLLGAAHIRDDFDVLRPDPTRPAPLNCSRNKAPP